MNKIKSLMTISALSIMVLILPAIASAQYGGGYGNGGYNNGQYGNNGYYTNIKSTVRDLKDRSKDLKKEIERLDDRRNNGGWNNGGWNNGGWNNGGWNNGGYNNNVDFRSLKNLADQFRKAADKLEDRYDDGRDQYKSSNEARRVLELGNQLEREIRRSRLNGYLQNWNQINNDLRIIANAYNGRNNGGWNNGNGNGGWGNGRGNGNGRPSWWPF
ncbi:MAG TPA: hypothetical protein PLL77_09725 [Pyrinomonadaceae bacterium]|nr:hypothetical protein [Pyrinomonadaceae bacterium]